MMMDNPNNGQKEIGNLNKLASSILEDRKNANKIVDLIDKLVNLGTTTESSSESYSETLIRCLAKIFNYFIDSREMVLAVENVDEQNTLNTYKAWLIKLYDKVIELLVEIVENPNELYSFNVQKLSLLTLIKFVEEEGKFPFHPVTDENESSFPIYLIQKIVNALISESKYNQELINIYANYYEYDDFIHFTLKQLKLVIDSYKEKENPFVAANLMDFIYPIRLIAPADLLPKSLRPEIKIKKNKKRKGPTGDHKTWIRLCDQQPYSDPGNRNPIKLPTQKFKFDYVRDARLYSSLWIKYLGFKLPPSTYKRALLYIDKFAIQHFENPLLLADFLIDSFKLGGIISLLSLSPLYTLIHKCNLEYPHFFLTLYDLLESAVTYVKYRARFLFWCDLFLTSSHISSKIVASFAKKLGRLALQSPPDTITILLPFIGNLFIRHPMIQPMLICKEFIPENDPFLEDETDPEKTNASQSYMWELKSLQAHYEPDVAKLAKKIFTDLPPYEWNLSEVLETTIDDIVAKNAKSLAEVNKLNYDISCDMYDAI